MRVPDLASGIDRRDARGGKQVVSPFMSPLEAFLAADMLVYQKLFNDEFVLTDAEEKLKGNKQPEPPRKGIYQILPNSRREEFEHHVLDVARRKWNSVGDFLNSLSAALEDKQ